MPSIRSSFLLALATLSKLAYAQTTVYACTATLVLPGSTVTNTRTISGSASTVTQVSTVFQVSTAVQFSTVTQTITRTTGGGGGQTTIYIPTTVVSTTTVGGGGGTCPSSSPTAQPATLGQSLFGKATSSNGIDSDNGSCGLGSGYRLPSGFAPAAMSNQNWGDAYYCGTCLQVISAGKSTYVQVVNQGGNEVNGVTLNSTAFVQLAPANSGQINVEWKVVSCNSVQGGLIYRAAEGSGANYLALTIMNAKNPIKEVSISTNGRNWIPVVRQPYNVFTLPNGSPGQARVDIRVTDITGKTIQDNGVDITSGSVSYGGGNF